MTRAVSFLRGINVGGNNIISMRTLQKDFVSLGFTNIKTFLNSGNIIFDTKEYSEEAIQHDITSALLNTYHKHINCTLRTQDALKDLLQIKLLRDSQLAPDTKILVTFLTQPQTPTQQHNITGCRITQVSPREIISIYSLSKIGTLDVMGILEKSYGKNITSRTINTVEKLIRM